MGFCDPKGPPKHPSCVPIPSIRNVFRGPNTTNKTNV